MNASAKTLIILWSTFWVLSFINPNTWHLICNNFNLNFILGIVCLYLCVCAFSLRRESPDMILGDRPLISEVVLSHRGNPRGQIHNFNHYINCHVQYKNTWCRAIILREAWTCLKILASLVLPSSSRSRDHPYSKSLSQTTTGTLMIFWQITKE
jgi:hypothetical protein